MFDLTKELATAKAGSVLRLPPGDYGDVRLAGKFAETVVITSEDPANQAKFRSILLLGAAGVMFEDVAVEWKPTVKTLDSENAVSFRSSERVGIRRSTIKGYPAVAGIAADTPKDAPRTTSMVIGWPTGRGVYAEASKGVLVEACDISGFHRGMVAYKADGLDLLRNDIHHNRGSTFSANGLSRAKFFYNHFHSSTPWSYGGNGDHGDFIAIQFASGQTAPNQDIQIGHNLFDQGDGAPIMGMLIGGQPGTEGLIIGQNLILGGHTQAMLLNQILSGEVVNNVGRRIGGEAKTSPGLLSRDVPAKFRIAGNRLGSIVVGPGTKNIPAGNDNTFDQTEASAAEIASLRKDWMDRHRSAEPKPPEPSEPIVLRAKAGQTIIIHID